MHYISASIFLGKQPHKEIQSTSLARKIYISSKCIKSVRADLRTPRARKLIAIKLYQSPPAFPRRRKVIPNCQTGALNAGQCAWVCPRGLGCISVTPVQSWMASTSPNVLHLYFLILFPVLSFTVRTIESLQLGSSWVLSPSASLGLTG